MPALLARVVSRPLVLVGVGMSIAGGAVAGGGAIAPEGVKGLDPDAALGCRKTSPLPAAAFVERPLLATNTPATTRINARTSRAPCVVHQGAAAAGVNGWATTGS